MDEQKKYEVIKSLSDHPNKSKQRAALELGCTYRHVNRMLAGYRKHGKAYFVHGNRGRKPVTTISEDVRETIVKLYKSKYYGANFTHFTELLQSNENINLSVSTVQSILEGQYILSPMVTHAKKKRIKNQLRQSKKLAKTQKQVDQIQANLIEVEDAHSRRPRHTYLGELLQMDASPHMWFGDSPTTLHLSIDDATGIVTGAWFDKQETLHGYYHVLEQTLKSYGIPYKFFTDRRTIFTYKKKNSPSVDEDEYTQFAYACKQLGIQLESSSVPQAKGRIERLNGTLQSRLPIELRLRGITTIEAANEFLKYHLKEFNAKFALPLNGIKSVFEMQPSNEKINLILAVLAPRTVDSGHCIQFQKKYYRMLDKNGEQVHYRKGTKAMTIQAFDGSLFCCVNDNDIFVLDEIPKHAEKSKELDFDYIEPKKKKQYIPPMSHPWRRCQFGKFVNSQSHRSFDASYSA